jgi:hypothetical protein
VDMIQFIFNSVNETLRRWIGLSSRVDEPSLTRRDATEKSREREERGMCYL